MAKRNSQLNFSVVYATSQTDQNPGSNIINSSPYSLGWISAPNAPMPQELVLDFGTTVSLTQLQFVSHQTKIPAEIILSIASDTSNWRIANFQELTDFRFSDNHQNNYKAREMRSATISNTKTRFLKLTITKAHPNRFNRGNQVGLVSVIAQGMEDSKDGGDPEISRLEREKKDAIDSENYALAQRIKDKITILQENRTRLIELARMKDEAVRNEDFVLAQRIKSQIDRIQAGEPAEITQTPSYSRMPSLPEEPLPPPVRRPSMEQRPPRQSMAPIDPPFDPEPVPLPEPPVGAPPYVPRPEYDDDRPLNPAPGGTYHWEDELENPGDDKFGADYDQPPARKDRRRRSTRGDDRPIRPRKTDADHDLLEFEDEPPQSDEPEEIDPKWRQEAEPFVQQFGERTVRYFYSKSVTNRVRGINEIAEAIESTRSNQHSYLFSRFCHIMRSRLTEEAIGVFVAATNAVMRLSDSLRLSGENIRGAIESHLPVIVKRLGDKKEQISKAAKQFIMWAAENDALGIPSIAPCLMAPLKKPIIWQNVTERLNIIQELLDRYGTVDQSFDTGAIINFVFITLESKSSEVRTSACKVCKVLAGMGAGSQINKMLQSSTLSAQTQNMVKSVISGR